MSPRESRAGDVRDAYPLFQSDAAKQRCEVVTRSKEDEERCAVVIADGEVVGAKKASDMDESSETDEDSPEEK